MLCVCVCAGGVRERGATSEVRLGMNRQEESSTIGRRELKREETRRTETETAFARWCFLFFVWR